MYRYLPHTEGTEYLCDVLPIGPGETIQLYNKVWPSNNENVWHGHIPKNALAFSEFALTERTTKNYFNKKKFQQHPNCIKQYDRNLDPDCELFAKLVWLTHDYFKFGGFEDPLGVHYNPRISANVIHPGGSRNQILKLFGPEKIEAIYFNTGGYNPLWLCTMQKCNIEELCRKHNWFSGAVADHGSLIPHFARNIQLIQPGIKKFQGNMYCLLSPGELKIRSNITLAYLERWAVCNEDQEYNTEIHWTAPPTPEDHVKSTMLVCARVNYTDKNFTVTCKNPIN